jgi:predicted Rossmann fold nucleotide-binding protein DprA/Smf involved in DNA uptake
MNIKIISGGQTGVDRAALDTALNLKIEIKGFCPKGRLAEDGAISTKYPLTETKTSFYQERTRKNIDMADGILIITINKELKGGTLLAYKYAKSLNKKIRVIDLNEEKFENFMKLKTWIDKNDIKALNIAGNRESNEPGIYQKSKDFLFSFFSIHT